MSCGRQVPHPRYATRRYSWITPSGRSVRSSCGGSTCLSSGALRIAAEAVAGRVIAAIAGSCGAGCFLSCDRAANGRLTRSVFKRGQGGAHGGIDGYCYASQLRCSTRLGTYDLVSRPR